MNDGAESAPAMRKSNTLLDLPDSAHPVMALSSPGSSIGKHYIHQVITMLPSRKPSLIGAFLAKHFFPDHCPVAHLAKLADADDLRERLRIEYESGAHNCCLLMLDIDSFHLVNRDFGKREGDRVLQAVTQVLLLNLRSTDLLCRYAGDRFAVLLPGTQAEAAHALADHLRRAVASLRHHAHRSGLPIMSTIRYTFRNVDAEPRQLLKELNRALERRLPVAPVAPVGTELPGAATSRA